MPDYKAMYLTLFNALTDALDAIADEDYVTARRLLIKAQRVTEEAYISSDEV